WSLWNLRGQPEKKKIISREGAYHGVTLAATSLSGLPYMHALFDAPLDRFLHTTKAHFGSEGREGETESEFALRCASELEALIVREGPDTVAAFWGEPVMGAGGVFTPPEGYWAAVQDVCRRHDVLVVADEVITGFGRLGTPFASHHYGIEPDMMIVAKAITSSYFPVSAAIVKDAIYEELAAASPQQGPVAHGHTTSMHPVGAAAALANLDIMEREGLFTRASEIGPDFHAKLRAALEGHPNVGEVRGDGLIAGMGLVAGDGPGSALPAEWKSGLSLHRLLIEEGLVSRALGDSLALCPPLVISEAEMDEVMVRFRRGLDRWSEQVLPGLGKG
ncbi:MAG: aminotransferase class III-fold pyridoxal phosphate-dependent enzyme, partial [Actinomycetota bacterium]|nr:aminotransferase class III-fold pyridoxal phosphate-dependent enzyme [Actinomycetota bacterium]